MAEEDYGIRPTRSVGEIVPPQVDYAPPQPSYPATHRIGMLGAGGVSEYHLKAYAACGWKVVAIADHNLERAKVRRDAYFPAAEVTTEGAALICREDITVLDITPHPAERVPLVRAALEAGKHVLSQKPFVLDLTVGEELATLADRKGVRLAVNQNGRWAPHFSYMRQAIASGLIGDVRSVDFTLQWDQTWITGNERFENIHHLILFDFAIHWFDIATCLLRPHRAESVSASLVRFEGQRFRPPALAAVVINYPQAQVRMAFNAHTSLGAEDVTTVVGSKGTLRSRGPNLNDQPAMDVFLTAGHARVPLTGCWFESGFIGTMGELLRSIEANREPDRFLHGAIYPRWKSALPRCAARIRGACRLRSS